NWYLLLDMPQAFTGGSPAELYRLDTRFVGMADRPPTPVGICSAGPVEIRAPATVPPRGRLSLVATGGSNAGFTWSFATNRSGGSIDSAAGAYVAGPAGSVTDTLRVTDSDGSAATRDIAVTAAVSISPPSTSVAPGGTVHFTAAGGAASGFFWQVQTTSGAAIDNGGVYKAGGVGGATDVVKATDVLGNEATATVSVTSAGKGGCASSEAGGAAFAVLVAAFLWRRRRAQRPSSSYL
ncbi:MAG TPA: MYXO-CTERM sorting domain-containing protein, partial [Myxococcales bacterium]|nr:MYXO-CTERM sorting domain-containing protein [Myxococcales bacterium]